MRKSTIRPIHLIFLLFFSVMLLLPMVALPGVAPSRIQAQSSPCSAFSGTCVIYDFTINDGSAAGWHTINYSQCSVTAPAGTYVAAQGWTSVGHCQQPGGYLAQSLAIRNDSIYNNPIAHVQVDYHTIYPSECHVVDSAGPGGHAINIGSYSASFPDTTGTLSQTFTPDYELNSIQVDLSSNDCGDSSNPGPNYISRIIVWGSGPTPTPGPTSTPTPLPTSGFGQPIIPCALIGDLTSVFDATTLNAPHGWQLSPGSVGNPSPATQGLDESASGSAILNGISLSEFHAYAVSISYHLSTAGGATSFAVFVGANPKYTIPVENNTTEQLYLIAPTNFEPLGQLQLEQGFQSIYSLTVASDGAPNLIVDSICLNPATVALAPFGGSGTSSSIGTGSDTCVGNCTNVGTGGNGGVVGCGLCTYNPTGDLVQDAVGIIGWLLCGINTLITCNLIPWLAGIFDRFYLLVAAFARQLVFLAGYIFGVVRVYFAWLLSVIPTALYYLIGWLSNLIHLGIALIGAIINQVILNVVLTVRAILSALTGFVQFLVENIGGWIGFLVQRVFGGLSLVISVIADGIKNLIFGLVSGVLTFISLIGSFVINAIQAVVGIAQGIITAFQNLFNAIGTILNASPIPPPGLPVCDDSAVTIPQSCVGIYMLDHTVLANGTVLDTILNLMKAAAGLGLIWWAAQAIIKALQSSVSGSDSE